MARINAAKKEEVRNKILEVADQMFATMGYDDTSTSKIALEVGVAEGTVFNYFKSKAELYWTCIAERYAQEGIEPNLDYQTCLEDLVYEATVKYIDFFLKLPKKVIKEMFGVSIEFAKKNPSLFKRLMDMDYRFMDTIKDIFFRFQEKQLLVCDNLAFLTDIFFGMIGMEFLMYVYEEDYDKNKLLQTVKSKISFLLHPYRVK